MKTLLIETFLLLLYPKINALTQDVVWSSYDTSSKINVAKFYALTNPKIK